MLCVRTSIDFFLQISSVLPFEVVKTAHDAFETSKLKWGKRLTIQALQITKNVEWIFFSFGFLT
jgi:hypothetical protein